MSPDDTAAEYAAAGGRDTWWHCKYCGDHGPALEPYEVGDSEPCIACCLGTSHVMTATQAAQYESEIAQGLRQPECSYSGEPLGNHTAGQMERHMQTCPHHDAHNGCPTCARIRAARRTLRRAPVRSTEHVQAVALLEEIGRRGTDMIARDTFEIGGDG